jgi:hypothetical protein
MKAAFATSGRFEPMSCLGAYNSWRGSGLDARRRSHAADETRLVAALIGAAELVVV